MEMESEVIIPLLLPSAVDWDLRNRSGEWRKQPPAICRECCAITPVERRCLSGEGKNRALCVLLLERTAKTWSDCPAFFRPDSRAIFCTNELTMLDWTYDFQRLTPFGGSDEVRRVL